MDEHMERCLDHMYMIASNNGLAYPNAQKAAMDAYMEVREENVKQDLAFPHDLKVYMALIPLVTLLLRRKDNGESGWK
jgi:hypothetical protein